MLRGRLKSRVSEIAALKTACGLTYHTGIGKTARAWNAFACSNDLRRAALLATSLCDDYRLAIPLLKSVL